LEFLHCAYYHFSVRPFPLFSPPLLHPYCRPNNRAWICGHASGRLGRAARKTPQDTHAQHRGVHSVEQSTCVGRMGIIHGLHYVKRAASALIHEYINIETCQKRT
jgi:hypothetical protein